MLFDGFVVTVYHSEPKNDDVLTYDMKRKTAESFAKCIAKFEKTKGSKFISLWAVWLVKNNNFKRKT